mmetsp:Transcript_36164/g.84971  ORF Transcript_36164/g.84971 Transcript_36164/m.84971 type:complete len:1185 (+) Transcript_36164:407-3961(+)
MGAPSEYEDDQSSAVVISGGQQASVQMVLRDQTTPGRSRREICELPGNCTVQDLYTKVATEKGYPPTSFELTASDISVELSEENKDVTLDSLGQNNEKIEVLITRASSHISPAFDHVFTPKVSATTWTPSASTSTWQSSGTNSTSYSSYSSSSANTGFSLGKGQYCGLSNQGATCYMNSLLQSLYMTPEFRMGVYKIPVIDDPDQQKDSICFQLQNLFAQMQLSDKRAVETKDLTKSFGWDSGEAFQQHDVQELCRVLFDELEERMKGSSEETLIKDLFQGYLEGYVRNLPGGAIEFESKKREEFMDVSLAIKQFGNPVPISSVEEGLEAFIKAETLEGDNQYQLDPEPEKGRPEKMMVDAKKGLQITDFPYVLTLQLKRFDFDHATMRRIKIADRVSFPEKLDVEPYLAEVPEFQRRISLGLQSPSMKAVDLEGDEAEAGPRYSLTGGEEADGRGPMHYDLYSVMVHSGSTFGGHYYAYIRSFENGKWYKFNDSSVSEASWSDVEQTFGGTSSSSGIGSYPSTYSYSSSASAYMLLYRRRDPLVNKSTVPDDMVPEGLRNWMQRKEEEEKKQEEEQRQQLNRINLTVYCGRWERAVAIDKAKTLADLIAQVKASFPAELGSLSTEAIRLRKYHTTSDFLQEAIGSEDELGSSLESLNLYSCTLAVETRADVDQPWPVIDSTKAAVKVWLSDDILDPENGASMTFSAPCEVMYVPAEGKLIDLKREVMRVHKVDVANLVVARANKLYSTLEIALLLENTVTKLKATSYGSLDGERFFVAKVPQEEQEDYRLATSFTRTPMSKAIDAVTKMVTVLFNTPGSERPEHSLDVDLSSTLAELKEKISAVIGLGPDEFRVHKLTQGAKTELTKVADSLSTLNLSWGGQCPRLVVDKGEPERQGVHNMTLVLLEDKRTHSTARELFTMAVEEDMLVGDIKKEVAKKLAEHRIASGETEGVPHLRLRETHYGDANEPRKVLVDDLPLAGRAGQMMNVYFKKLNVQVLEGPEPKEKKGEVVVELMRWYPAEWKLGPREELVVGEADTVDQVRAGLAARSGVSEDQLEIGKSSYWTGSARSELEALHWQEIRPRWEPSATGPAIEALDLREGGLYYYKCKEDVVKELSEEEKKEAAQELRDLKRARKSETTSTREKGLSIKKKDKEVVVEDSSGSGGGSRAGPGLKAAAPDQV